MSHRTRPGEPAGPGWAAAVMSELQFRRLSTLIYDECGIRLSPARKTMLEARLQKRLRRLGIRSFREYGELLDSPQGGAEELACLIDAVTTNKTEFFREPAHFSWLAGTVLPRLMAEREAGLRQPLRLWSAGCASGEEPYSLAMVLADYAGQHPGFRFAILATDICGPVLEQARVAVYPACRVTPVPPEMQQKYLLRSRDRSRAEVRVAPELRGRVEFRRLNLLATDCMAPEAQEIIFCRNVLIYFDRAAQDQVLHRFCRHLTPGGYLFLGHSENLSGFELPLTPIASTVYRKMP